MPRACNIGPVPPYCEEALENKLLAYIDGVGIDLEVFELYSYNSKSKQSPVSLPCIVKLRSLIHRILSITPAGRVHKADLKRQIAKAIDARPKRAIMSSMPRTVLIEKLATQVAHACCLEI